MIREIKLDTINQRIAHYRKGAVLSQTEMAKLLGIDRSTYVKKEKDGNVDCQMLLKIAEIVKVDPIVLLTGKPAPVKEIRVPVDLLTPSERSIISLIRNAPKKKREEIYNAINNIIGK